MARGRKPSTQEIKEVEINEVVSQDLAVADQLPALVTAQADHQGAILARYGDGLPYERLRYLDKCRYHMARSAEEALEVGRCLIVMKECEGHGDWLPLLEELGVDRKVAARMMQASMRFSNVSSTRHLIESAKSKTKLFELMVLDDEELEALNAGESVRGIELDDVDRMSVSELRRALRKEQAEREADVRRVVADQAQTLAAKDKVIAQKSQRIAELVEEKNRAEHLTADERAAELERQLTSAVLVAVGDMQVIRQRVHAIRALDDCPIGLYTALQGALDRIVAETMGIANDYGIALNLATDWTAPEAAGEPTGELDDPNAGESFAEGEYPPVGE